jgi:hypothetical protein
MLLLRSTLASIISKVGETAELQGPLTRLSDAFAFTVHQARSMSAPAISKSGGMKLRAGQSSLGDGMFSRRVMDEDAPGLASASVADQEGSNVVAEAPDPGHNGASHRRQGRAAGKRSAGRNARG